MSAKVPFSEMLSSPRSSILMKRTNPFIEKVPVCSFVVRHSAAWILEVKAQLLLLREAQTPPFGYGILVSQVYQNENQAAK